MHFKPKRGMSVFLAATLTLGFAGSAAAVTTETVNETQYYLAETAWDLDFEGQYAGAHRWGGAYVSIYDTATSATSSNSLGNSLTAHKGNTDNVITIDDCGDVRHGNTVKLVANDDAQVQLNEFTASPSGEVIVFEWDFMLESLPTTTTSATTIKVMGPQMGGGKWTSSLGLKTDKATPYFSSADSKTKDAAVGTWYNVKMYADTVRNTSDYYVDGALLSSTTLPDGTQAKGQKVTFAFSGAKGAVARIDNFKAYSLNRVPQIQSVKTSGKTFDVTFSAAAELSNFVNNGAVQNVSLSYKGEPISITSCTQEGAKTALHFEAASVIPTAAELKLDIDYKGIALSKTFTSDPADLDVTDVSITQSGTSFTANAKAYNKNGAEEWAIMILALYDGNDRVVKVAYGAETALSTGADFAQLTASDDKAVSAKVFFIKDWKSSAPLKHMFYESAKS